MQMSDPWYHDLRLPVTLAHRYLALKINCLSLRVSPRRAEHCIALDSVPLNIAPTVPKITSSTVRQGFTEAESWDERTPRHPCR